MLLIIYLCITFYLLAIYLVGFVTELMQEGESSLTLLEFLSGLIFILTPVFNVIFLVACLDGMIDALATQLKKIKFKTT